MIIKLWDKTEITVTKEQAEQVKQAIDNGADHIEIKNNWVRCSAISMIKEGGQPEYDKSHTLPERTELTEEDHAKARKKIAEIRQQMIDKTSIDTPTDKHGKITSTH